jgi:membrane-bound lytic murein transglycosylase B
VTVKTDRADADAGDMSRTQPMRRRAALAARGRVTLACLVVGAVIAVVPGAARAESADEAQARADAAADRLDSLQQQVDRARADYERALHGVAGAVSREVDADEQAALAGLAALNARQDRAAAVRALEQSGGSFGMLEGVLTAASPSELAARWKQSTEVVDLLATAADGERVRADLLARKAAVSERRTDRVMVTVSDVESALARLDAALAEQQEVLDTLDARARELAQAERTEARIAAERAAAAAAATDVASTATAGGIPTNFLALYQAAATTCPGLPWPVLAAVGQVESGHGSNMGPSSAGAMGPMQFLPSTFAGYAVDGDRDGVADIWNPSDAIYSAARYLCANGGGNGPQGLYNALWRYNHADWYVLMVVRVAGQIAQRFGQPVPVATR